MKPAPRQKPFAKRSLGQNFLSDPNYIKKIIDAVAPSGNDAMVEIGPGRGALTDALAASGANVTAIELDSGLVQLLRERFAGEKNFTIIEKDALQVDFRSLVFGNSQLEQKRIKLVANLPYNISTAILQRLAEQRDAFSECVLMFQKEVVDRITAAPSNAERGFLTVMVESSFETVKLFDVPPTAFRPVPKVWSSVVRLIPKPKSNDDFESFREIVSLGFGQKRKTILNNLKGQFENAVRALRKADIETSRRAETLTLDEWKKLAHELMR